MRPNDAPSAQPSTRAYNQSRRRVQAELTRVLVLQATRDLLMGKSNAGAFTLDAVALQAGVSRATVFNLFGGKPGLLHALFDELSARAGLMDVDALLTQQDPCQALRDYVAAFAAFYESEHVLLKRLRAHAVLDADFARLIETREDKRSAGLLYLVQRLQGEPAGTRSTAAQRRRVAMLKALLVMEVFESLAGADRPLTAAAEPVLAMAEAVLLIDSPDAPGLRGYRTRA